MSGDLSPLSLPLSGPPNLLVTPNYTSSLWLNEHILYCGQENIPSGQLIPWYGWHSIGMLAPNLLSMSLDYLDRKSIIKFAMTCRQVRAFVMSYLRRCAERIVKRFNLDPMRLNGLMLRCGAVISGECARLASMPVVVSRDIHPLQLEFKTPWDSSQFFADQLLEMGEFRLDRKTKFYAQDGELSKKVWYIQHGESTSNFEQEIHVISFANEPLNPDHPYYGFFSYIPISILVL